MRIRGTRNHFLNSFLPGVFPSSGGLGGARAGGGRRQVDARRYRHWCIVFYNQHQSKQSTITQTTANIRPPKQRSGMVHDWGSHEQEDYYTCSLFSQQGGAGDKFRYVQGTEDYLIIVQSGWRSEETTQGMYNARGRVCCPDVGGNGRVAGARRQRLPLPQVCALFIS